MKKEYTEMENEGRIRRIYKKEKKKKVEYSRKKMWKEKVKCSGKE